MMRTPGMHAETFAILRHIEVHGPRSRDELVKGLRQATADLGKRLNNLTSMGYVARDETTRPVSFTLTHRARAKLASPEVARPSAPIKEPVEPKPRKKRNTSDWGELQSLAQQRIRAMGVNRGQQTKAPPYRGTEMAPSLRPHAMDFTLLPSRFGDRLHYRDGRVTDMAGNPLSLA